MYPTLQAFLADQGWEYDASICHTGADKPFVDMLYHEMQKCGLKAFFDKKSLKKGDHVQMTIAEAIIRAPFCVVVLSDSFLNKPYPEAELRAALAFPQEHKRIIPVFYKMTADQCNKLTRKMYKKLSDITGWERERRTDKQFARCICQDMKQRAKRELSSSTSTSHLAGCISMNDCLLVFVGQLTVWRPDGEAWKADGDSGLELLIQLKNDLKAGSKSECCGKCTNCLRAV